MIKTLAVVGLMGIAGCAAAQELRSAADPSTRAEAASPNMTVLAHAPASSHAPPPAAPVPPAASPVKLSTSVNVRAPEDATASPPAVSTEELTGNEVLESAGTWSDLPRYLATLPGVIAGSDIQNAFSVRGGNSFENLFTVDRLEVPNINQLALDGSTGGLGSMLDPELIGSVAFHAADYGAQHTSRLSSLTEIRTIDAPDRNLTAVDLGYSGGGIRLFRSPGRNQTLLLSVRESVTNLFLKDIGLNGSPEFTNSLVRYTVDLTPRDHLWIDSLSGRDTLKVRPTWLDLSETNAFNTNYSGWRNTTGFVWQHTSRSDAVSTWLLSNSQDVQKVQQGSQFDPVLQWYEQQNDLVDVPFSFSQNNGEGVTQAKYEYHYADKNGSGSDFGFDVHQNRVKYKTNQTGGIFSPYSQDPAPQAAFSLSPAFSTFDRAAFFDLNADLKRRVFLRSGVRLQTWGTQSMTGPKTSWMPQASVSAVVTQRLNLRASYIRSAQLPPYSVIGGAPGNTSLGLIQSNQMVAGGSLQISRVLSLSAEAYRKTYTGYPVSIDYPQLSLATLAPVIDEPFLALLMRSAGAGISRGVEISIRQNPIHHVFTRTNITLSDSRFSGLDGMYRHGSNDLPFVMNTVAGIGFGRYTVTARETMTSGRPYTPALLDASFSQNRLIFDLTQINAMRGPLYNRLDLALNREVVFLGRPVRIHVGALNVLKRANFYTYDWAPRCECSPVRQNSMGLQPDLNVSYVF